MINPLMTIKHPTKPFIKWAALTLGLLMIAAVSLHIWRAEIARFRVNHAWKLDGAPARPSAATLDGTYLPAMRGGEYGAHTGFAIRANKVIFESWSDIVSEDKLPGEFEFALADTYASGGQVPGFQSGAALVVKNADGASFLIHARGTERHQFLVLQPRLASYTLGTLVTEQEREKWCLYGADFVKVSDTPTNEFHKFTSPIAHDCTQMKPSSEDMRQRSETLVMVMDVLFELHTRR